MRFPADEIAKIRLGERTRLTTPYDGRRCPFQEAGYYILEREVDIVERQPCAACEETGKTKSGKECARCGGFGDRVYYRTQVKRVESDERVQVTCAPERMRVDDFTDDYALQEAWESADEWRDAFFATHGEHEWVWTFTFELTTHVPQYLALQQGQVDPAQYVSSPLRALEDADAPTADEYRAFAERAEAKLRKRREATRLRSRAQQLTERADKLDREADNLEKAA